jgi:TnsA endonuclease N terminal
MSYKGRFKPKNPSKYKGNPTDIVYRSRWELKLMMYLDDHKDVIEWSSEEFFIPYKSPVDGRWHRYFPDFFVKKINKSGVVESAIIEVKPASQTKPPPLQSKPTRRYITEVMTYGVNQAKWKAATEYCADRNWTFHVFTEKELDIKF